MKSRIIKTAGLFGLMMIFLLIGCQSSTEPEKSMGSVTGTVLAGGSPLSPAYIISDTDLLAVTGSDGTFTVDELPEGTVTLICSALNYSDAVIAVKVVGQDTVIQNFSLTRDNSTGRVYGEFQDQTLMDSVLAVHPEVGNWNGKQIFEGTTYATLQTKWLQIEVPECRVFIGDSLIAYADAFGQFWAEIQSGTYPLTGICEGYEDATTVVQIMAEEKAYVSLDMVRNRQ